MLDYARLVPRRLALGLGPRRPRESVRPRGGGCLRDRPRPHPRAERRARGLPAVVVHDDGPVGLDDDLGPAAVNRVEEEPNVARGLHEIGPATQRVAPGALPAVRDDDGPVVYGPRRLPLPPGDETVP